MQTEYTRIDNFCQKYGYKKHDDLAPAPHYCVYTQHYVGNKAHIDILHYKYEHENNATISWEVNTYQLPENSFDNSLGCFRLRSFRAVIQKLKGFFENTGEELI